MISKWTFNKNVAAKKNRPFPILNWILHNWKCEHWQIEFRLPKRKKFWIENRMSELPRTECNTIRFDSIRSNLMAWYNWQTEINIDSTRDICLSKFINFFYFSLLKCVEQPPDLKRIGSNSMRQFVNNRKLTNVQLL